MEMEFASFFGRCSKILTMPNFKCILTKHEIFQIIFRNPAFSSQK